jgi:hypothetical protein
MAGKINVSNKRIERNAGKVIPTASWEVQNQAKPETAGATTAGAQLHDALAQSRGDMGLGKKI